MAGSGRSREYDIAFRLNGLMDSSFRRSMGDAERHIEELERALQQMNQRGDLDDLRRDAQRADGAFDGLRQRAESFGETLNRVAEFTGAKALIDMASSSLENIVGVIGDQSDAMAQFQASTGMTADQMLEISAISKNLYRQNYGEGFEDLADVMATVKQYTNQTGDELEKTSRTAITFRDVFKEDVPESLKAADTMMKKFGITSEQAYNLMAQGAQKGLNKSGELVDTANEYSVYFDKLGYSANDMFNLLGAGMETGAFSLDKVGDAVKEFGIRIKDGSDSTTDAMALLFAPENIEEFTQKLMKGTSKSAEYMELLKHVSKDTAAELVKNLKAGGTKSGKAYQALQGIMGRGDKILNDLSTGAIQGKDAMQEVIDKLGQIKDPILQSTLGVALFGTQFEDMESDAISALGSARDQFDMVKKTMEEVDSVKYSSLSQQFSAIGRELMTNLVIPMGEDLMPLLQGLAKWMGDNEKLLMVIALGAPAAALTKNTVTIVKKLLAIETAAAGAGGAAGGFTKAIGLLTSPIGLATAAVGALALGVVAYKKNQEDARQELIHMGDQLRESGDRYEEANDKAKLTNDLIWQYEELSRKISASSSSAGDLAGNSEKLANQQERQEEVVRKLQELYPETLSNYDVESGKIQTKLGLLKQESDAEVALAKLRLEKDIAEGEQKLPDTLSVISRLQEEVSAAEARKDALDAAIPSLKEYAVQFERLMMAPGGEDKEEQLEALVQKVKATGESIGLFIDDIRQLGMLNGIIDDLDSEKINLLNDYITNSEDLSKAKQSYEELYDKQRQLIELNLGGTLGEYAQKFGSLADEGKRKFNESVTAAKNLNDQMNLIPSEKKINVEFLYSHSDQYVPKAPKTVVDIITSLSDKYPKDNYSEMDQYAEGGIARKASIFGEDGPEIAIPLNNKPRSRSLLDMANDLMGHNDSSNERVIQVTSAPVINMQGADAALIQQVREAIKQSEDSLERRLKSIVQQQRRVSLQ